MLQEMRNLIQRYKNNPHDDSIRLVDYPKIAAMYYMMGNDDMAELTTGFYAGAGQLGENTVDLIGESDHELLVTAADSFREKRYKVVVDLLDGVIGLPNEIGLDENGIYKACMLRSVCHLWLGGSRYAQLATQDFVNAGMVGLWKDMCEGWC